MTKHRKQTSSRLPRVLAGLSILLEASECQGIQST